MLLPAFWHVGPDVCGMFLCCRKTETLQPRALLIIFSAFARSPSTRGVDRDRSGAQRRTTTDVATFCRRSRRGAAARTASIRPAGRCRRPRRGRHRGGRGATWVGNLGRVVTAPPSMYACLLSSCRTLFSFFPEILASSTETSGAMPSCAPPVPYCPCPTLCRHPMGAQRPLEVCGSPGGSQPTPMGLRGAAREAAVPQDPLLTHIN